nr:unnamed protein product [Callosobruchus analis]
MCVNVVVCFGMYKKLRLYVPSKRSTKDVDLGLEVLFFDDPVNSIQSANLVKGDYASTKENLLNNPSTPKVKGGTTEKTVSIIEQIINSIAANLTSPPPSTSNQGSTSTTTTTESSKSAILKLATKKTKTDNDTDTTDKPTTIIEQILNSLSAIQATDDTNSVQVETTTAATVLTTQSTTTTTEPSTTSVRPLLHPHRFEVRPASVKIISANDFYTEPPDDNSLTTVTIASRTTLDNLGTTISSTTTTDGDGTTTTVLPEITTLMEVGTTFETTTVQDITTTMSPNTTDTSPPSNRSGKLLNSIQDLVSNSIDVSSSTTSTTPDYFIFAVLNNNTILRKRPPTIPNKDTPFVIVGVYPNNTVIRKFPNGTEVPMDPIVRGEQTTASIDTNNLPLETDAGWYTAFQSGNNLERGGTTEPSGTSKAIDHVYRIPPRKSNSYNDEANETIKHNNAGTIPANIFSTILQGVGTTSTEGGRFPEISFDVGSGTTTTSTVVQIPDTTSTSLGGFWGYNQILNIQDLIRGNDEEISREQVVTVEMTTRPSTPELSTSTTTTKAPTSTTTAVPKVPPTKPVLPQTPFVEEIITVPSISADMPTTTAVPTTMPTLTTEAATTMAPTTEATTTAKSTTTTSATTTIATTSSTTTSTTTTQTDNSKTATVYINNAKYTLTPTKVTRTTTTSEVPSYLPPFLTTFFPNYFTPEPTRAPRYTTTKSTSPEVAAVPPRKRTTARTTPAPHKKRRTTITTTTTTTTTTPSTTTTRKTTTTPPTTTTRKTTTTEKVLEVHSSTKRSVDLTDLNTISVTPKSTKKKLTPEQKRNLETLMQLEKEQAALLQQLSFLTTSGKGNSFLP